MNTRRDPHLSESLHRLLDTLPEKELPERYRLGLRMLRKDNPQLWSGYWLWVTGMLLMVAPMLILSFVEQTLVFSEIVAGHTVFSAKFILRYYAYWAAASYGLITLYVGGILNLLLRREFYAASPAGVRKSITIVLKQIDVKHMAFMGMGLGMFGFIAMKATALIALGTLIVFEGRMPPALYWVGAGLGGIVTYGMWKMNTIGFPLSEKLKDARESYVAGLMATHAELLKANLR
tara:strand:- start:604 stop:1305 length:702 start_codon:yes stop_codon:yes gene_type:complete